MLETSLKTPTPRLAESVDFYTRLGWTQLEHAGTSAWFTDGAARLCVDPARFARTTVVLHTEDGADLAARVAPFGRIVEREGDRLAADPSGAFVLLTPSRAPAVSDAPPSALGNFAGLSLEAVDPERAVRFWEALGWQIAAGGLDEGWVQLGREGAVGISVMGPYACPHLFPGPGLTFFNAGENPEVIAKIRAAKIPIAEEITAFNDRGEVDNVILRDPGGTGFFVFND